MRELFRTKPWSGVLLLLVPLAAGLAGCTEPSCTNYSVLDYLDSTDRDGNLAHVGLVRSSATTRLGPAGNEAQCSVWEQLHYPGTRGIVLKPQYYSVRLVNNGWVLDRQD